MTKTTKEIARALRCIQLKRGCCTSKCDELCAYYTKKKLPPECQKVFGIEEIPGCNREQIAQDAADMIERLAAEQVQKVQEVAE